MISRIPSKYASNKNNKNKNDKKPKQKNFQTEDHIKKIEGVEKEITKIVISIINDGLRSQTVDQNLEAASFALRDSIRKLKNAKKFLKMSNVE